ncbi:MAG: efflux RND transporter periplasmic adaptor subunit, partial [Ramlibacter sp.]
MTSQKILGASLALVLLAGAGGYGLYTLGMKRGMNTGSDTGAAVGAGPATPAASTAVGPVPQSIAEGEDATRRHIAAGIKAGETDPANGRKILYYHDPMVPGNKFDKPAKSPFMDMMLVPVYAD